MSEAWRAPRAIEDIRMGMLYALRGLSEKEYAEVLDGFAEVIESLRLAPDEPPLL